MDKFKEVGAERLLQLADILDAADALHRAKKEPTYDQEAFAHECGTPACALGHWAHANPDRWSLKIGANRWQEVRLKHSLSWSNAFDDAQMEFGIEEHEAEELFDFNGCGSARTGKQAAKYIREFVKHKLICEVPHGA